jgi:beta-glucosidase
MANRTYRYFKGKPLYAFGDGLSYTTFAYSALKLSTSNLKAGDPLTVEADVRNTGSHPGDEVAELYLTPPNTPITPKLVLAGFERLHLNPGETKHLTFTLDPRTLSQVNQKGTRAVTPGNYKAFLGSSQPSGAASSTVQSATFAITGTRQLPR